MPRVFECRTDGGRTGRDRPSGGQVTALQVENEESRIVTSAHHPAATHS